MTTHLHQLLLYMYPSSNPPVDWLVQDDGAGPYLAYWDAAKLGPQPTQKQLEAVDAAATAYWANKQTADVNARTVYRTLRQKILADGVLTNAEILQVVTAMLRLRRE